MSEDACRPEGQVCRLHARGGAGLLWPDALGPSCGGLVHVDSWYAPCIETNQAFKLQHLSKVLGS